MVKHALSKSLGHALNSAEFLLLCADPDDWGSHLPSLPGSYHLCEREKDKNRERESLMTMRSCSSAETSILNPSAT